MFDGTQDARAVVLSTRASEGLYDLIRDALDRRRSGMTIIASSRMGLSTALAMTRNGLREERHNLPVVHLDAPSGGVFCHQEIWYSLSSSMGWKLRRSRNPGDVRRCTAMRIAKLAHESKCNQALLIVDNAHSADPRHLQEVARLEDALKIEDVPPHCLLSGPSCTSAQDARYACVWHTRTDQAILRSPSLLGLDLSGRYASLSSRL